MTNQDVEVTITSNEQLKQPTGWEISNDKKTISKKYFQNNTETITIEDLAGNEVEAYIGVNNIDKQAPTIKVEYKANEDGSQVTVYIVSNEKIKQLEGWEISEDGMTLTKTYMENIVEILDIEDLVGNKTEVAVDISTIDENSDKNSNTQNGGKYDPTTSDTSLPNTGIISIIIIATIMIIISAVLYIKYKQYERYTKNIK